MDPFSNKNASLRQKPLNYRRIRVYTKSLARYRKERERRRKIRVLAEKGLSQAQIAKELGVSTRTVKRDWDKVRSYAKAQANKELKESAEKRKEEFEHRYEDVPPKEQLKLFKNDVKDVSRMAQRLQHRASPRCGEMVVTLHLNDLSPDGFPYVEVFPNRPKLSLTREFDLKINAWKNGLKRELCTLHFNMP
jgi:predicted transcriptional regulator